MGTRLPFGDALRTELGVPESPLRLGSSPRSRVWRVELPASTAVVKQLVGGPEADERYAREVAALRLAARSGVPVVPALLATDPAERVLVLEDLEHQRPAGDWIVDYAAALARLHATGRPDDAGVLPRWQGPTRAWPVRWRSRSRPACPANSTPSSTGSARHPDMPSSTGTPAPATISTRPRGSGSSTSNKRHWAAV